MRRRLPCVAAMLFACAWPAARAQNTVTVSANPPLLRVTNAVAGSQPGAVVNATTTYTVRVTTGGTRRITGRLLSALPAGTTITVQLVAPPGATSLGAVAMDLTERDLVINIPRPTNATRAITYTFTATVAGGVLPNASRVLRLRLRI